MAVNLNLIRLKSLTENLSERDADLRAMASFVSAAPIGFALLTSDLIYKRVNQAYASLLNTNPDELWGTRLQDTMFPDVLPELLRAIEASATGATVYQLIRTPEHLWWTVARPINGWIGMIVEDVNVHCMKIGCPNRIPYGTRFDDRDNGQG